MLDDLDVGVERFDEDPRRLGLRHPDPLGVVDHLALQVGGVDHVVVDEADRADAGRGQVERRRRAEPAGAEQQHLRVEQLELAVDPDLGQQRVARVALALLGGHAAWRRRPAAPAPARRGCRRSSRRRCRSRAPAAARRRSPSGCRSGSRGSSAPTCRARPRRSRRRAGPAAPACRPRGGPPGTRAARGCRPGRRRRRRSPRRPRRVRSPRSSWVWCGAIANLLNPDQLYFKKYSEVGVPHLPRSWTGRGLTARRAGR